MGQEERSTIYGGEADRYDRFRPGYPPPNIDPVFALDSTSSTTRIVTADRRPLP